MQWIILLLITFVLVILRGLFGQQFRSNRWKRNKGKQNKEVVVPRQRQVAGDLEVSEELGTRMPNQEPQKVHENLNLHHRAEKYPRSALITPLQQTKARSRQVEPLWEIYGFDDTTEGTTAEKEGTAMDGLIEVFDGEFASEVGAVKLPETVTSPLRILIPDTPAEHCIQIGTIPKPISGHDMPIQLTVSPSLTALVKDPYWAFVYWVLPAHVPTGQWELRVQNLTDQSEFFEKVDAGARRWYLHLNQPGNSFTFELGYRDEYGHFHPVLSSSQIQMPPDRPSDQIDADWLTISELYQGRSRVLRPQGSAAFALELGGASEMIQNMH